MIAVYGGVGYDTQIRELRRGVDILVACPGRLIDLVERRAVELDGVEIVVIDEADRMADMGFLPQVRKLLDLVSENRQTILFSATLDGDIGALAREYQNDPVRHEVGETEPDLDASDARVLAHRGDRAPAPHRQVDQRARLDDRVHAARATAPTGS